MTFIKGIENLPEQSFFFSKLRQCRPMILLKRISFDADYEGCK